MASLALFQGMVEGASKPYAQALVRAKTLAYLEREKPKKQLFSAATLSMVLDTVGTSPTNLSTIDILRKYGEGLAKYQRGGIPCSSSIKYVHVCPVHICVLIYP